MFEMLIAQNINAWGIGEWAIAIIVVAAIAAVVALVLRQLDVAIPAWVWHMFFILLVAVVGIAAVKFLMRL